MILAGDIGGTNARLAFFTINGGRLEKVNESVFPSAKYKTFDEIVVTYVSSNSFRVEHACVGIAGPIHKGRSSSVNLAWVVDAATLAAELKVGQVRLINDLEANAYGVAALGPNDFEMLNQGAPDAEGNAAVIAAGTGLGEAGLYWDGKRHWPFATEGGHADFAPRDDGQTDLFRYLHGQFGHVSWERVLSGPGLYNIYKFLRDSGRAEEPSWLAEAIRAGDPSATVSKAGLEDKAPICTQALDFFVDLYGAEAGNLALKVMATGGLFLGGGIAPRIAAKLKQPRFMEAFSTKGRIKPLLEAIPVRIILNDKTALLGAARCAALTASLL